MTSYAHKVQPGDKINLASMDSSDTRGIKRPDCEVQLEALNAQLTELQEIHYAAGKGSLLIVLQGLDTAGKDGTVRHVVAQFNPAGCRVESFKVPTPIEQAHDFLWRIHPATPPDGGISVLNRSHYEDVLVARVHTLVPRTVWEQRYTHINNFEALLTDSGTTILKFFLFISKQEQRERLLAREHDPVKAWKLSTSDWPEHALYDDYVAAYEDVLERCSTEHAPWFIVPADHKWFRNLAVAQTIVDTMKAQQKGWQKELEERGREHLAAIIGQREQ